MFPNSILVVLPRESDERNYEKGILIIPKSFGKIMVIDGQHRLFSYADEDVRKNMGENCSIMVTAIVFKDPDSLDIKKYSAKTFIEINMNQTSIRPTHLNAVSYEFLEELSPDAMTRTIAAQIILRANEKKPTSKLYGLFDTNQSQLGPIQTATVIATLKPIIKLKTIEELRGTQKGARAKKKKGYESLFGVSIDELAELDEFGKPETLVNRGVVCLEQYFNHVARTFTHDWPKRREEKGSSLEYAKMIAAFVKLLWKFISEGCDWREVQKELEKIKTNVMALQGIQEYSNPIFQPSHEDIPGSEPRMGEDYKFLNLNRVEPVSIKDIQKKK